jgi:hypothetical protein
MSGFSLPRSFKRAAKEFKRARQKDILVVEDEAPCHTCKLAIEDRTNLK